MPLLALFACATQSGTVPADTEAAPADTAVERVEHDADHDGYDAETHGGDDCDTFARPAGTADVSWQTDLVVTEAFDGQKHLGPWVDDVSSCLFDTRTGRLLVLSDETSRVLDVALDGTVVDDLWVDISHAGDDKPEGITLNTDDELVIAGEPNVIRVYGP